MTAKGAAQPDRPDETAPPSDGGAVSPGAAADASAAAGPDAARAGRKADSGSSPATSAKSGDADDSERGGDSTIDLEVTLANRGDGSGDGAAGSASSDPAAAAKRGPGAGPSASGADSTGGGKADAGKSAAEKPGGDKGSGKAGAADGKDRAGKAGTEDRAKGGAAGDGAARDHGDKAGATKDTAEKNKESEEVTQGKTAEEAVAPAGDQSDDNGRPVDAELETLRSDLGELTRDLQRVTAEYANYRKRVDRDRTLTAEQATGVVLTQLLPVLDDLDRARDHGDLVGPFGSVADQLIAALTKFGLTAFGAKGDPFDPTLHEAVSHTSSPDVTETTCVEVMRRGYLLGERLLRPALVGVADPE